MPFVSSVRGSYGPQSEKKAANKTINSITGGAVTTAGGYRIHTFTSTGSSTFDMSGVEGLIDDGSGLNVEYLVIAGGGPAGGGSGAGGYLTGTLSIPSQSVSVNVGNLGSPRGGSSTFHNISTVGGGAATVPGGSGGGSNRDQPGGQGNGTPGQGNRGGWSNGTSWNAGGGGGGAGGVGGQGNSPDQSNSGAAGAGGAGLSSSITGSAVSRAFGYGGNWTSGNKGPAQPGPLPNTGSGGGSGVVIVRYQV